jgi:hypothetical protein
MCDLGATGGLTYQTIQEIYDRDTHKPPSITDSSASYELCIYQLATMTC